MSRLKPVTSYSSIMPHMLYDNTYYPDPAKLSEEDLPVGLPQSNLALYLAGVLGRRYADNKKVLVARNLAIYPSPDVYLAPDVLVFKNWKLTDKQNGSVNGWPMFLEGYEPPNVVIEISSSLTWENDIVRKPSRYIEAGIKEYFAYDPQLKRCWPEKSTRVLGWRNANGKLQEITPDDRGWLWSEELEVWFASDEKASLRLYDEEDADRLHTQRVFAKLRELGVDPETL